MSNIIGKQYNPYAMPSGSSGLIGGLEIGQSMARQRGLAAGMQKVANGDESGWKDIAAVAPEVYMQHQQQQEENALAREKLAQQKNGGSWTTDVGRMWQIANDPNETPENRQLAQQYIKYSARDPLANQGWNYAGRVGTLQGDLALGGQVEEAKTLAREKAQEQVKREVAARDSSNRVNRIDSLIGRAEEHKDLLQPYSSVQAELGKWTDYGMTDEERIIRGELIRDVSDIKNDLIARARQNGQTGINTAREIELATKGIESSDWATLVGGLNALKNYENIVSAQEAEKDKQEDVTDYETWLKQGSK